MQQQIVMLFVTEPAFEYTVSVFVEHVMLFFVFAKDCYVFFKVGACEKDAGAVGTFEVGGVILFGHVFRLLNAQVYFFTV